MTTRTSNGAPAAVGSTAGTFVVGPLETDAGERVDGLRVHYRVYGDPAAAREPGWVLVFHALTGSAEIETWWAGLLGPGRPLDPARRPIVAANLPGSCYGSTGPRQWLEAGRGAFPSLTTRDLAVVNDRLLTHLGVDRVALATGGSLGGMVALQWGLVTARPVDRLVVLAAPAAASAQAVAWNAAQRMAIEADPRWRGGAYAADDTPDAGLAAARAIAMITYRSPSEFAARFGRTLNAGGREFAVEGYLRRHGEKLVARFDAASYHCLTGIMDRHDVGPIPQAAAAVAGRVGCLVGVGIDTDILYPAAEVRGWVDQFRAHGANAQYREITSVCGHDAFLIELDQVAAALG